MTYKGVVIDAGHGGTDSGALNGSFLEKDYTLKISNYIHDRLDQLGIENELVRTDDITINPNDRVKKIKSFYGDGKDVLLISNHINAGGGEGAEIIYALRNNDNFSKIISDNLTSSNRYVRKYYQKRYPSDTSKDYYFIHRDTGDIEAVIIEYGFLDNENDKKLLEENWKEYSEIIVKSICEYMGVPYKEEVLSGEYYIVQKGDTIFMGNNE